ncbi:DNA polymerase zeta catalytic subunit [Tripterygium wilfordii]|uniref:DNA polymerase zeta catalytic subunit n=1 Tax=Tripterygium wilfordii TaxID=458696 RepID=A0A7J7D1V9_TRIWF|nr:DNA polymerase zeta catalytic subunit [Tripterygium wilfordii]
MAKSSISHLLQLRRRFSLSSQNPNFILSRLLKPFSTASASPATSPESPKPSSLSARMSFVFDQIDSIERERSQKDETLQKIRAWRQSRNNPTQQNPELGSSYPTGSAELTQTNPAELEGSSPQLGIGVVKKKKNEVELVHPWPEWIELMERLVQQNYFDHKRRDEDKIVQELGLDVPENADADGVGIDFSDFKTIQTACLNFGKDRFDILRSLSRQDIQVLVGYGCPTADKKVVFSAKLLRKHVHLDEGDVCSSCSLRSSCERAYLLTNKEDEARTIDIMRVLLAYGFDPINGSLVNKSLMKQKSLKTVVRKLLHEVVKLSAVPIDPNLPPPIIKRPPPKVKQPPPPPKKRVGRDDVEMKKGDWLCPKCDFMNFAKNTVCLQCDAKRPKRQLLPGEWECPQCNFLNYRRNMACFHCDCKRPPDEFVENQMQATQRGGKTRLDKIASRDEGPVITVAEIGPIWHSCSFGSCLMVSLGPGYGPFLHSPTGSCGYYFRLAWSSSGCFPLEAYWGCQWAIMGWTQALIMEALRDPSSIPPSSSSSMGHGGKPRLNRENSRLYRLRYGLKSELQGQREEQLYRTRRGIVTKPTLF